MGSRRRLKLPAEWAPRNDAEGKAADWVTRFVGNLTHSTGEWSGKPFQLHPWQSNRILRPLFGTLQPDGRRQYRTCYIEIPRKNGKTELAAAVALFMLMGDDEKRGQVYGAAVDRDQAGLVFSAAQVMVRNDPELSSRIEVIPSTKRMLHGASGSIYRAIPGDSFSAHGFNASAVIYDELHAAPNRELWDVLTTSMGARRQPLIIVITTAGWDRHSICWELHEYAEKVRDGVIQDPTFLPVLYGAPREANWLDEKIWAAANPALGDFRSLEDMRIMAKQAREIPARQNTFRRLYLNQWTESETRWLDLHAWEACAGPVSWSAMPAHLEGRRAWLGLDLSATQDLTAAVLVCPDGQGGLDLACHFWVPEERVQDRVHRDRVPYDLWASQGALTLTPGASVDYGYVRSWVNAQASRYQLVEVDIDKWNATQLTQQLKDDGLLVVDIPQNIKHLSGAAKELEKLVINRKLRHGGHPILTWCAANVVVRHDSEGNYKPDKQKSSERIDGISALLTALSPMLQAPTQSDALSVALATRGLLTL